MIVCSYRASEILTQEQWDQNWSKIAHEIAFEVKDIRPHNAEGNDAVRQWKVKIASWKYCCMSMPSEVIGQGRNKRNVISTKLVHTLFIASGTHYTILFMVKVKITWLYKSLAHDAQYLQSGTVVMLYQWNTLYSKCVPIARRRSYIYTWDKLPLQSVVRLL